MQMDNFNRNQGQWEQIWQLADGGLELASFSGAPDDYSISIGQLTKTPFYLFKLKELGPTIKIFKLQ